MAGHTDNAVIVHAPIDLVWDMTNDIESWPHLFSEYATAEVLARDGNTVRFRLTTYPADDGTVWSWISERTIDVPTRTVLARRIEPGAFEYMHIRWTYHEVASGVEMRWVQDFHLRPDAPLDDKTMTERININTALQMTRIKSLLEKAAANRTP
jgi:aromatase